MQGRVSGKSLKMKIVSTTHTRQKNCTQAINLYSFLRLDIWVHSVLTINNGEAGYHDDQSYCPRIQDETIFILHTEQMIVTRIQTQIHTQTLLDFQAG